jgi:flagellar basal-body rod protein FlgC
MGIASTIAVSGLNAASLRVQVAASNIANAMSDGPLPGAPNPQNFPNAYTPLQVTQTDVVGGGTTATVRAVSPATLTTFDPTAPFANSAGFVASPNVDLATEMVQLLIARTNYAANALVIRTDAQMSAALLNITA